MLTSNKNVRKCLCMRSIRSMLYMLMAVRFITLSCGMRCCVLGGLLCRCWSVHIGEYASLVRMDVGEVVFTSLICLNGTSFLSVLELILKKFQSVM